MKSTVSFAELGLAPKLVNALAEKGLTNPTPIQEQAIPVVLQGGDVLGIAQTGTGKTFAFGLPMLHTIAAQGGQGLVVLPTRELAVQVNEELMKIGKSFGLKTAVLIGGENMGKQQRALAQKPRVIIATPGRLQDFLDQKQIKLNQIKVAVLDEADRMLDMGFLPQIKKIFVHLPKERQTLLFSATMPEEIVGLVKQFLKAPVRVEVAPAGSTAKKVTQEIFFVGKEQKLSMLQNLLQQYKGTVLIFSRTKFGAKKITRMVHKFGHAAAEIHSNRSLSQRLEALNGFKSGKYRVLVATDIAARGIDVTGIEMVLNYDLPDNPDDYVHRIGRTGRADKAGHAISFATPDQKRDIRDIERIIRTQLPVSAVPNSLPKVEMPKGEQRDDSRRGGFGRRGRDGDRGDRSFGTRAGSSGRSGGRFARRADAVPAGDKGFNSKKTPFNSDGTRNPSVPEPRFKERSRGGDVEKPFRSPFGAPKGKRGPKPVRKFYYGNPIL